MRHATGKFVMLCLLTFAISTSVQAIPMGYNFKYEFNTGEVLSGMLEGELQVDLDTIAVTNLLMATFSGLPGIDFQTGLIVNTTSISGATQDFITDAPSGVLAGFGFTSALAVIGIPSDFGFRFETYSVQGWSLAPKETSVPAPATLALFGLGLAVLGWSKRKKA